MTAPAESFSKQKLPTGILLLDHILRKTSRRHVAFSSSYKTSEQLIHKTQLPGNTYKKGTIGRPTERLTLCTIAVGANWSTQKDKPNSQI
jgi:hypothetical protein